MKDKFSLPQKSFMLEAIKNLLDKYPTLYGHVAGDIPWISKEKVESIYSIYSNIVMAAELKATKEMEDRLKELLHDASKEYVGRISRGRKDTISDHFPFATVEGFGNLHTSAHDHDND